MLLLYKLTLPLTFFMLVNSKFIVAGSYEHSALHGSLTPSRSVLLQYVYVRVRVYERVCMYVF